MCVGVSPIFRTIKEASIFSGLKLVVEAVTECIRVEKILYRTPCKHPNELRSYVPLKEGTNVDLYSRLLFHPTYVPTLEERNFCNASFKKDVGFFIVSLFSGGYGTIVGCCWQFRYLI